MFRAKIVFVVLLLNILFEKHISRAAQSLDDFFPFGLEVNDTRILRGDDNSHGPIPLPYIFPYFDNNHRQIFSSKQWSFLVFGWYFYF